MLQRYSTDSQTGSVSYPTFSWMTLEGLILVAVSLTPALLAALDIISNDYLGQGMNYAAIMMFASRYWHFFIGMFVSGQILLLFTWLASKRLPSFRQALVFALLALVLAGVLQHVLVNLFMTFVIHEISSFEMIIHDLPTSFKPHIEELSQNMFRPCLYKPLFLSQFLNLKSTATALFLGICLLLGLFLTYLVWTIARRVWHAIRHGGRKRRRTHFTIPIVSTRGVWLFLILIVPALLALPKTHSFQKREEQRPNIILISIDTLRADHLSCYGYQLPTSPTIDRLAHEGLLFTKAISQSSWTLPSHVSQLTGFYPVVHRCNVVQGLTLSPKIITVSEYLLEHGYHTLAVTGSHFVSPIYGLGQGFEQFVYRQTTADNLVEIAISLLRKQKGRPFFLFLHLFDPHDPYTPPQKYRDLFITKSEAKEINGHLDHVILDHGQLSFCSWQLDILARLYDAEIRFTDAQLKRLFNTLMDLGIFDETAIILTSDHGEAFGEHNEICHGSSLFTEQIHVPLILRYPPRIPVAESSTRVVEASVQILPTILDLANLPIPTYQYRQSLLDGDKNRTEDPCRAFSETTLPMVPQYSVQDAKWKIIAPVIDGSINVTQAYLFNQTNDWENNKNLTDQHRDVLHNYLENTLQPHLALGRGSEMPQGEAVKLSPLEIKQLRSLGYIR